MITRITGQELLAILQSLGYFGTLQEASVITLEMQGLRALFFVTSNGESIQAYSGFQARNANLSTVNEWNRTKRFSRAYIDSDGDPVIELDLDLAGGVNRERIVDFIRTVQVSLTAFARHVFGS